MANNAIAPGLVAIFPAELISLEKKPYIIFGRERGEGLYSAMSILPYIFEYETDYDSKKLPLHLTSGTVMPAQPRDVQRLREMLARGDCYSRRTRAFMSENSIENIFCEIEGAQALLL